MARATEMLEEQGSSSAIRQLAQALERSEEEIRAMLKRDYQADYEAAQRLSDTYFGTGPAQLRARCRGSQSNSGARPSVPYGESLPMT